MTGATCPATDTSAVLLLRLAGPMQSWGYGSAFNRRNTRPEPTKSGVVGLLAAALGRSRHTSPQDLAALTFGVRVDQPGSLLRDYHTASDYTGNPLPSAQVNAKGRQKPATLSKGKKKYTHVTERFYLQDAVFLVAFAGPRDTLDELATAVRRPAFPLALGRRSCTPTQPIVLGVRDGTAETVLTEEQWHAADHARDTFTRRNGPQPRVDLPATLDDPHGTDMIDDVPVSFEPGNHRFTTRHIRHTWLAAPTGHVTDTRSTATTQAVHTHDPFALLGW